jgi:hypothetical protein
VALRPNLSVWFAFSSVQINGFEKKPVSVKSCNPRNFCFPHLFKADDYTGSRSKKNARLELTNFVFIVLSID